MLSIGFFTKNSNMAAIVSDIGYHCRQLAGKIRLPHLFRGCAPRTKKLATMIVPHLVGLLCYAVLCGYSDITVRKWVSTWISAGIPGLNDPEKVRFSEKSLAVIKLADTVMMKDSKRFVAFSCCRDSLGVLRRGARLAVLFFPNVSL